MAYFFGALIASWSSWFLLKRTRAKHQVAEIVLHPSTVLHTVSKPVDVINEEIIELTKILSATLRYRTTIDFLTKSSIHKGLSAPQIGYSKRIIACGVHGRLTVMINPEIITKEGIYSNKEQCLSLPGYDSKIISRSETITVKYLGLDNSERTLTAKGRYAGLIEHEIDHLNGILYIDQLQV